MTAAATQCKKPHLYPVQNERNDQEPTVNTHGRLQRLLCVRRQPSDDEPIDERMSGTHYCVCTGAKRDTTALGAVALGLYNASAHFVQANGAQQQLPLAKWKIHLRTFTALAIERHLSRNSWL